MICIGLAMCLMTAVEWNALPEMRSTSYRYSDGKITILQVSDIKKAPFYMCDGGKIRINKVMCKPIHNFDDVIRVAQGHISINTSASDYFSGMNDIRVYLEQNLNITIPDVPGHTSCPTDYTKQFSNYSNYDFVGMTGIKELCPEYYYKNKAYESIKSKQRWEFNKAEAERNRKLEETNRKNAMNFVLNDMKTH